MASRDFNAKQALEREVKTIFAQVVYNSGVPSLVSNQNYGVASVVDRGTGDLSLILDDAYSSLKFAKVTLKAAAAEDIRVQIKSEDVAIAKEVRFLTLTGATPTDLADGSILIFTLELKNSTEQ
jgi:hypothetical protein